MTTTAYEGPAPTRAQAPYFTGDYAGVARFWARWDESATKTVSVVDALCDELAMVDALCDELAIPADIRNALWVEVLDEMHRRSLPTPGSARDQERLARIAAAREVRAAGRATAEEVKDGTVPAHQVARVAELAATLRTVVRFAASDAPVHHEDLRGVADAMRAYLRAGATDAATTDALGEASSRG
jgi:hypothetical protein